MTAGFGEEVRQRRTLLGLTQEELAIAAEVSRGTVRNAEAGKPLMSSMRDQLESALNRAESKRLSELVNRTHSARDAEDGTVQAIGAIRDQLAGLLSQIDSSAKPRPDKLNPSDHRLPGPEWHRGQWVVRCIDDDPSLPTSVYITPPHWYHDGDFDALCTADARKFAMAIFAACDWADGLAHGVAQLDARREGSA